MVYLRGADLFFQGLHLREKKYHLRKQCVIRNFVITNLGYTILLVLTVYNNYNKIFLLPALLISEYCNQK